MNIFTGSTDIQMLCWSVVLGLAQLIIATAMATKDQGVAYNISVRDQPPPPVSLLAGRFQRAFGNFRETFVYFAVAVLVVTVTSRNNSVSALGTQIYFWARLIYVPVYAAGIPVLRTVTWGASIAGLIMILLAALA